MNTWIGDNSTFAEADNWTDGIPTADDILLFTGPQTPTPPPGLPPPPYSHQSITFPTTADLSYAGIRILNGYTGTVTFPANVSFAEYTQNSGATAQYADTVVSVNTTFGWVGGVINTTSNNATVKLKGVLMGQIGEDTTTLSCGSKIVLDQNAGGIGSTVRLSGVVTMPNSGGGVEVLANCTFNLEPLDPSLPPGWQQPTMDGIGGNVTIDDGQMDDMGGKVKSVLMTGGRLHVLTGGMEVTDTVPGHSYGVMATTDDSVIVIRNGETLKAAEGVWLQNGELRTWTIPNGTAQIATIDGEFFIDAGQIELGVANGLQDPSYSTLKVKQDAHLSGGTFQPKVNGTLQTDRDAIDSDGTIHTTSQFVVEPWRFQGTAAQAQGKQWEVLVSATIIDNLYGEPTNGDPDNYSMFWSTDLKKWIVKHN